MNGYPGMNGVWNLRRLLPSVRIARVDKWEPWYSTPNTVLLPLGTTVLFLGVLLAWLGTVLEPPLPWSLAAATTLVLGLVLPSTLRLTLSFSQTEKDSEGPPST